MTATTMNAPRVGGTTPGRTAVSSLMLILGSRLGLFAMFQMLIAGGLAAAGVSAPWHRSAGWWPITAALSNILSLAILWSFTRAEGLPLPVVFGWTGGAMKRDLPLLVGVLLLLGPAALIPNLVLANALFSAAAVQRRRSVLPYLMVVHGLLDAGAAYLVLEASRVTAAS